MALASTAAENGAVAGVTGLVTYVSLHTATPGTTGASEVSGGGYARQSVTWAAASGGSQSNSNVLAFTIPASTTVGWAGGWTAASAGTYEVGFVLTSSVMSGSGGTLTVTIPVGSLTLSAS